MALHLILHPQSWVRLNIMQAVTWNLNFPAGHGRTALQAYNLLKLQVSEQQHSRTKDDEGSGFNRG